MDQSIQSTKSNQFEIIKATSNFASLSLLELTLTNMAFNQ